MDRWRRYPIVLSDFDVFEVVYAEDVARDQWKDAQERGAYRVKDAGRTPEEELEWGRNNILALIAFCKMRGEPWERIQRLVQMPTFWRKQLGRHRQAAFPYKIHTKGDNFQPDNNHLYLGDGEKVPGDMILVMMTIHGVAPDLTPVLWGWIEYGAMAAVAEPMHFTQGAIGSLGVPIHKTEDPNLPDWYMKPFEAVTRGIVK